LINFENAPSKSIVATQFQYRLKLRSTLFELVHVPAEELQPAKIRIQGRGYGHGVGMNQWGAQALAENMGWNYRQILGFYYDDTVIESL
jgi:stage II sporulation protein D